MKTDAIKRCDPPQPKTKCIPGTREFPARPRANLAGTSRLVEIYRLVRAAPE